MSTAAAPLDASPAERLHPAYLLTGLAKSLRGAWGVAVGTIYFLANQQWWVAALILGGYVIVSVTGLLLHWLRFEYRVGADELRIESGLLSRNSRVIPFDRVTDIDLEQGPVHRLLGLARVRLETGASSAAKDEEGVLDTISLDRAEALREHIRNRRAGPSLAAPEQAADEAAPLYAMDRRRVVTAGLFNFSLAVIAGLFGLTQTLGDAIGFDPFKRQFWLDLLDRSGPLRELVAGHQVATAIAGTILLLLIGIGTGMIRTILREHGFRLDRTATGLRRRRGLLTLTDVSVPVKRVQAAILATGPIRRRFGWFTLKLQSLAQDGGEGDHVVAPLAREEEAAAIQASIGQSLAPPDANWRPVSRAYVLSFIAMMGPALLATMIAAYFVGPWIMLWVGGVLLAIGVRALDWRRTRFALDGETLFIDKGWWRQRRTILPVRRIQSLDLAESFWTRLFGVVALRIGVAGGKGPLPPTIPALSRPEAEALRSALLA